MIADPIIALQEAVTAHLRADGVTDLKFGPSLSSEARWRPQIYEEVARRAWHVLTEVPASDSWKQRIAGTLEAVPGLTIGLVGPEAVLATPEVLDSADQLGASLLLAEEVDDCFQIADLHATASEFVYEREMQLGPDIARTMLNRGLQRALDEPNAQRKGVLLEVVSAVMFSQVSGFEVIPRGISRRSQQVDIAIHNRNIGGILGGSPMVLGEAKNWNRTVGPKEYAWLWRKMAATNGRAKLGFFITTDHHTKGVYTEAVRDTMSDGLIVLLDSASFPAVWRNYPSITKGVEQVVMKALEDQRQRLMEDDE